MVDRPYQICANCVMDTTDSRITFDARGVCDHCNTFYIEHPAELAHRRARRAPSSGTSSTRSRLRAGQGLRLHHRHERRHRQLVPDLPGQGGVRAAPAGLPRRRRVELPGSRQQHREAGGQARAGPLHRGHRLGGDAGPAARVLQGRACRTSTRRRITRSSPRCTSSRTSTIQVHPDRSQLLHRVRAQSDRVDVLPVRRDPAPRHPSAIRHATARDLPDHEHPRYKVYLPYIKKHSRRQSAQLLPLHKVRRDEAARRALRLAAVSAEALRVALHALLRGLLAADQVRLRHAAGAVLEPDPDRADDARRSAGNAEAAGLRPGATRPGLRIHRNQARHHDGRAARLPRRAQQVATATTIAAADLSDRRAR